LPSRTIVAAWKLGDGGPDAANGAAPREQGSATQPSPAFTAEDLTAEPTTRWVTNGGTLWKSALLAARPDRHLERRRSQGVW
jgi:hypothetical protein